MDLKKFLSYTPFKLGLAILLFALFVPFITYFNGTMCNQAPCPSSSIGSIASWAFQSLSWSIAELTATQYRIFQFHGLPHIYSLDILLALFGIAICYVIACALVHFLAKKPAPRAKKK